MLGDRFASTEGPDSSTYRFMEEIMRSGGAADQEAEGDNKEQDIKMQNLKLLLLVKEFDNNLLKEAVQTLTT